MVNCELIRLNAERKPMKAIYPVIKDHPIPEMNGELDHDGQCENRFDCGYFTLLRGRLIALWAAEEISATQLSNMLAVVAEGNLNATPFSDESNTEANDETVVEMFNNLKDVNNYMQKCSVEWITPFTELNGYADEIMCKQFSLYLLAAVSQMRQEVVRILSDEQLNRYEDIAEFLQSSPYGVGIQ